MFKKPKKSGGFFFSLAINLCLNFELLVAAIVLLVLHYTMKTPMFLVWIALGLWLIPTLVRTAMLFLIVGAAQPTDLPENRNPYSSGSKGTASPSGGGSSEDKRPPNKNPYSSK